MKIRIAICFLLFWSSVSGATSYFVMAPSSQDMTIVDSLRALISASVNNAGEKVADQPSDADYVLKTDVLRLGQAYIVTVTRMRNNAALNSSRQKAASVEELDDASDRAVRAAILDTKTKTDLRVGEVKERDENELRRRIKSHNTTYLGFGAATYTNLGTKPLAYDLAIGHNWEVTPRSQIRILGDGTLSNDWKTYLASFGLGLNFMFTDEDSSPYAAGLVGFGFAGSNSSSATTIGSFSGTLGLGWMFFRTSSTQFDIFAGYTTLFGNNTLGSPGVYGLRVGLLF